MLGTAGEGGGSNGGSSSLAITNTNFPSSKIISIVIPVVFGFLFIVALVWFLIKRARAQASLQNNAIANAHANINSNAYGQGDVIPLPFPSAPSATGNPLVFGETTTGGRLNAAGHNDPPFSTY